MDPEIFKKFERLSVKNADNQEDIDFIINSLSKSDIHDPDTEWKKIQEHYTKLKYLKKLTIGMDIMHYSNCFVKPFIKFMDSTDSLNEYYIRNIGLDPMHYDESNNKFNIELRELRRIIKIIGRNLEYSINISDPIKKLDASIDAYKNLIFLIEDIRTEKCKEIIDKEFINEFEPKRPNK